MSAMQLVTVVKAVHAGNKEGPVCGLQRLVMCSALYLSFRLLWLRRFGKLSQLFQADA